MRRITIAADQAGRAASPLPLISHQPAGVNSGISIAVLTSGSPYRRPSDLRPDSSPPRLDAGRRGRFGEALDGIRMALGLLDFVEPIVGHPVFRDRLDQAEVGSSPHLEQLKVLMR
jgi:hypothetical protein